MTRRTRLGAAAIAAAVAATAGAVAVVGAEQASPVAAELPTATATVQEGELSALVSVNGTLTHRARPDGSSYALINRAQGTYTEVPSEGDRVDCGDVLYRVDDAPVLLLCGAVPAYRDLRQGHVGRDVRQLNRNLRELGHDIHARLDPGDAVFTWRTQAALRRLQDAKGLEVTGELEAGDAVVLPRSVRIAKVTAEPGASARPGGRVALATSGTFEVQIQLDATQQGEVRPGDRARITLPGARSVSGRVDRIGRVARTSGKDDDAGDATVPAYLSLDDPTAARGLDRAPVQVDIATEGVQRALSVPVTAVIGRAGGGFAVEVVRDDGPGELVAVKLGLFDTTGGRVEVEGDLRAGDRVVVPSP